MSRMFALFVLCLSVGCVAGPGDFASDESDFQSVEPEQTAAASDVKQASALTPVEERGEFASTSTGLKYRILKEGKGRKPNATSNVTCHYRGWLDDGTEFDSSYKSGRAANFPLDGVIAAWTEGLQLIQEGGAIELEVPSELGYGDAGFPPVIPGGATLHFEVELIKVK